MRVLQAVCDLDADSRDRLPVRRPFRLRLSGRFRLPRQDDGAGEGERVGEAAGGG